MDFIDVLTRIFGTLGLVLLVGSYQMKTRPGILGFQIAATFCFCCQFALLGALTGAVMNSIGLVRAILYYFKGRNRFFSLPILPVLMVVVSVAVTAFTFTTEGWLALLPGTGMVCTSISGWLTKPLLVRTVSFPSSPVWLIYNVINKSYEGVLAETLCMISIVVGILRHDIDWKKLKKNN